MATLNPKPYKANFWHMFIKLIDWLILKGSMLKIKYSWIFKKMFNKKNSFKQKKFFGRSVFWKFHDFYK